MNKPSSESVLTISGFCGSSRRGSLNQKLLDSAAEFCGRAGHRVELIDLAANPLPLFNQDLENDSGIPVEVAPIQSVIAASDAVLIASPEYNGGYTPLFKNTIDWISRIDHLTFFPKYVGLMCATNGKKAGARAIVQMEQLFANIFVTTHAPSFGIGEASAKLELPEVPNLDEWVKGFLEKAIVFAEDPPTPPG